MQGTSEAKSREQVEKWLATVGLQGFADTPTYQLSGGMQQRVALARCLINDPEVILMDEPLGALDALTREKMQSLVLELWKKPVRQLLLLRIRLKKHFAWGTTICYGTTPGKNHKEYQLPFAEWGLDRSCVTSN